VGELVPFCAPVPCGQEVDLHWFSKRQPTVDSSVFGADLIVMKNGIETHRGSCYKLRMISVSLSDPIFDYGENMYVVHNIHHPGNVLQKKSNSICYHAVRTSAAMGESIIWHVPSIDNPANICTEVVPGGQKWNHCMRLLLHDFCD
jgi:hypothetical protein